MHVTLQDRSGSIDTYRWQWRTHVFKRIAAGLEDPSAAEELRRLDLAREQRVAHFHVFL
jgi:hypothetical protein